MESIVKPTPAPRKTPPRARAHRRKDYHSLLSLAVLLWLGALGSAHAVDGKPIPDTIQRRVASCTACHGQQGEGSPGSGFFPRLAGKPAGYIKNQLENFRAGRRKYAPMEYTVAYLSPAYMDEIAQYFAAQQITYVASPLPRLPASALKRGEQLVIHGDPARGVPACSACHGKQLTGVQPAIPGLIGLPYDYISAQLGAWRTKTRASLAPDCMSVVANKLSDVEVSAVAAWLASQAMPADTHAQPAGSLTPPLRCGVVGG